MITRKISKLLGITLMSLSLIFITSCEKEDSNLDDVSDAVTLNMLNESNGKTMLGVSNVYINKANNFFSSSSFIAEAGKASGVGVNIAPKLTNLVNQAAVTPGHIYQIFDNRTVREFPSGTKAIDADASYYRAFVASNIMNNNTITGAVVTYVSVRPNAKGLPEDDYDMGTLNEYGDQLEMSLPKGAECYFDDNRDEFHVATTNGKLVITLNANPDNITGPYGDYHVYIRLGNVYRIIDFEVEYWTND